MSSSSPFDLEALLAQLSLKEEVKPQVQDSVIQDQKDDFSEPIKELGGLRLRKPYQVLPYQVSAVQWMREREKIENTFHGIRGGLWDIEMGLGKTLMTLLVIVSHLMESKNAAPTLIIAPKSLICNWRDEVLKFFGFGIRTLIYFPEMMEPKTLFQTITRTQLCQYHIIITTYETISRHAEKLGYLKYGVDKTVSMGPGLLFLPLFYRIVTDESHVFANPKGTFFKGLLLLNCEVKMAMTGTVIRNYDSDVFVQLRFLGFKTVTEVKKWSEKIYHELKLRNVIYSLTLKDAQIDLPPLHEENIDCPLDEVELKLYERFKSINRSLFEDMQKGVGKRNMGLMLQAVTRWRQICVSCYLLPPEERIGITLPSLSSKLKKVQQVLQEIPKGEKVVIFSNWTKALLLVQALLPPQNTLFVKSSFNAKQREQGFEAFKNDPTCQYLLITYGVGSVGLNFTMCQYMILLEPWYSAVRKLQAQKRIHRLGQKKPVFIKNFLVPNSVESKILEICHRKTKLSERYLAKTSPTNQAQKEEEAGQMWAVLTAMFEKK